MKQKQSKDTLGQELLSVVKEALTDKKPCEILSPKIDIMDIRRKLKMTQKEFSDAYQIQLNTLRKWEQKKRVPNLVSMTYLRCIQKKPHEMREIVNL